jgi:hypothetical protein
MMDTPIENIETLMSNAGEYLENKSELFKMKLIDKTSEAVSSIAEKLIMFFIGAVFFVLLTIGLALLIGYWLGHNFYGFFIMAAIYGIVGLIIHMSRNKLLKTPIANGLIHKFLN